MTAFELRQFDQIPGEAGIYVWFIKPNIPLAVAKNSSSGDQTGARLRKHLRDFSEQLKPSPLRISARGMFRDSWSGTGDPDRFYRRLESITTLVEAGNSPNFPHKSFNNVMESEELRIDLLKLLDESFPLFWTPVYIGKAENLHTRLNSHAQNYYKLFEQHNTHTAEKIYEELSTSTDKNDDSDLYKRLVYGSVKPEQCRVYILITQKDGKNTQKSHDLACAIEWLLNTWNRPTMGKI